MHITQLQGAHLRCFTEFSLTPASGVNLIVGENGAGKSSLIEALHILGYGRSFRGRVRDGLIQQGHTQLQLVVNWQNPQGHAQQAGLQHNGANWAARMNGETQDNLSQFCQHFPILTFEPGSHALITGSSDNRRRFVDWALFHVEPEFIQVWRRFNRVLKQRNALLKTQPSAQALSAWDQEFAETGEALGQFRQNYLNALYPQMCTIAQRVVPEYEAFALNYQHGWREGQVRLLDALRLNFVRDMQTGYCGVGPHRADWQLTLGEGLTQQHFSRGQGKLLALAALLAQARHFHAVMGFWPILCFDDLASELDKRHFQLVADVLSESNGQIWITGTESDPSLQKRFNDSRVFHVEHGRIA